MKPADQILNYWQRTSHKARHHRTVSTILNLLAFLQQKNLNNNLNDLRVNRTGRLQLSAPHRQGGLLRTPHTQCYLLHLLTHRLPPGYLLHAHLLHDAHLWLHDRLGAHTQLCLFGTTSFKQMCNKQEKAVCFTRVAVKFIIFLFPIFGLWSTSADHYMHLWQIHAFIIYMAVITVLLVVYEIATCCCVPRYPAFIFEPNNLTETTKEVKARRKEFD